MKTIFRLMKTAACLILFSMAACIAPRADATTLSSQQVACPGSDETFFGIKFMSTNNLGGADWDFLQRPVGAYIQPILIWTCPYNGFSAYSEDFEKIESVPAELLEQLEVPNLTDEEKAAEYSQRLIPFEIKIDNAALYYKKAKKDNEFMGNLYLLGAWLARIEDSGIQLERAPEFIDRIESLIPDDLKDKELPAFEMYYVVAGVIEKTLDEESEDHFLDALYAAEFYRLAGEHVKAGELLSRLDGADEYINEIADISYLLDIEKEYQAAALEYFTAALDSEKVEPENLCGMIFLTGELNRRQGNTDTALDIFSRVMENVTCKTEFGDTVTEIKSKRDLE